MGLRRQERNSARKRGASLRVHSLDGSFSLLQAVVFEEIATMDFPFEGIPTVPPRKDVDHMVSRY